MLKVKKLAIDTGSVGSVIFDPNILSTGYARKVYAITDPDYELQVEAHIHENDHHIVVLVGDDVRLAYQSPDGVAHIQKLEPGHSYYVPPNLPHQLAAKGRAVVETYVTSASLTASMAASRPRKIVLEEGLFELAARQGRENAEAKESTEAVAK